MASSRNEDTEFMTDLRAAIESGPSLTSNILLLSIVSVFVILGVWSYFAELDEVTSGEGRVIPSSQVKVIQNLEGGILRANHVREGQIVEAGQLLLTIDDTIALGQLGRDSAKVAALQAAITRLEAERDGIEPIFPPAIVENRPDLVASEMAVYQTRSSELRSALNVYDQQIDQKKSELIELRSKVDQLRGNLALAQEEHAILQPLVEQGVSAKIELIRLQRTINQIEGDLTGAQQSIPRVQAELSEVRRRREEREAAYKSEVAREIATKYGELRAITEVVATQQDVVKRTEVRSPVRGTVNKIMINTEGGVVKPGEDLIEIVPIEDNLLVEARIRPQDVAFLHPGQEAQVKITAYDFAIFGGLDAKLELISSDTIMDEEGERYYQIRVRTEQTHLLSKDEKELPIIPGMVAQVDILTGKKTVFEYLIKPILRAQGKALRER